MNTKNNLPVQSNTLHPKSCRVEWYGKPYYSLDAYCKNTFQHKCYKIALNAHMSCPNRDGSLDTRGCIFCSAGGSGDFAVDIAGKSVEEQLTEGLARFRDKFSIDTTETSTNTPSLIAYFQAYTNTYASTDYLRKVYTAALDCPLVCGISIGTRPDCLPEDVISLLQDLKNIYPDKFIWIELGLQTIHEETAHFIRRGYPLSCFEDAVSRLKSIDIPVIVHLILGLPGETPEMMLKSVQYLNQLLPFGVKLQLLHILEHTDLAKLYQNADSTQAIKPLDKDEYIFILINCIRHLDSRIVIHRLTGDGPKDILLAPRWSQNKRDVLNSLHMQLKKLSAKQGDML
ncbi:MAG: TIGR01212 family radical SAM protein [Lachnospiraceae bacterium]|nr:TIGR01212 family radical SAM protein [Lachnospiraceae bacterium]